MKWIHISCMHITCANNLANRIIWYAVYENVLKSPCILIIAFVCVCTKRNQRSNTYCREWETESAKKRRADNEQIQTNWLDKIQFYMYKYDKIMMAHNKSPMSMLSIGSSSSRTPSPLPKDVTQAIAAATAAVDESSESENETEPARIFQRRVSTSKNLNGSVSIFVSLEFCRCFYHEFLRNVNQLATPNQNFIHIRLMLHWSENNNGTIQNGR